MTTNLNPNGLVVQLLLDSQRFAYIQGMGKTNRGHDIIRVLPGRYASPLSISEVIDLVNGQTEFLSVSYLSKIIVGQDVTLGRYPVPLDQQGKLWFRILVDKSESSPRWWLEDQMGNTVSSIEFSTRFPDVSQERLPLQMIESPNRLRWLIDVGWLPKNVLTFRGNWYPDESGQVVKGSLNT